MCWDSFSTFLSVGEFHSALERSGEFWTVWESFRAFGGDLEPLGECPKSTLGKELVRLGEIGSVWNSFIAFGRDWERLVELWNVSTFGSAWEGSKRL